MKQTLNLLTLFISLFLFANCGGSEESTDTQADRSSEVEASSDAPARSADSEGNAPAESDDSAPERTATNGEAIAYQELNKFLPDAPQGYKAEGEIEGTSVNMQGFSYSQSNQTYSKDGDELEITLADYSSALPIYQGLTMQWNMGTKIETNEQKAGVTSVGGHKGWENYDKKDKTAELFLGISDRFYLIIRAENQDDLSLVKKIAGDMDLDRLAKQ